MVQIAKYFKSIDPWEIPKRWSLPQLYYTIKAIQKINIKEADARESGNPKNTAFPTVKAEPYPNLKSA